MKYTSASTLTANSTLIEVVDHYIGTRSPNLARATTRHYSKCRKWLPKNEVLAKPASDVSVADIDAVLATLNDRPGAKLGVKRLLSAAISESIRHGVRQDNPVFFTRVVDRVAGHKRWPKDAPLKAMRKAKSSYLRMTIALMYFTAQRLSDVISLTPNHRSGDRLMVTQQKTGADVVIPIVPELDKLLKAAEALGLPYYIRSRSADTIRQAWHRERKPLGLEGYTLHGLRKTASCEAAEGGATEAELQALLGHRSAAAALIYRRQADQYQLAESAMYKRWKNG